MDKASQFINPKRHTKFKTKEVEPLEDMEVSMSRPTIRAECPISRPCPYVGCRYHLYLDIQPNGNVKFNFSGIEPWELTHSCALDLADRTTWVGRGNKKREPKFNMSQQKIGRAMNLKRQSVQKIEETAMRKLKENFPDLFEFIRFDPMFDAETPI